MNIRNGLGEALLEAQMQALLTKWLRGLEPTGTPFALRVRTFADLRDEAARPSPRFARLRPILSTASSVASAGAAAGVVALVAILGATLDRSGGVVGAMGTPLDGETVILPASDYYWMPDPLAVLALLVASAVAGAIVFVPWLRNLAGRLAFGRNATEPAPPLPLKRRWRAISPLVWVLAVAWVLFAVQAASTVVSLQQIEARLQGEMGGGDPSFAPLILYSALSPVVWTTLAIAVPLRYPLRDRSAGLLLLGALAPFAGLALVLVAVVSGHLVPEVWYADAFLSAASIVAIAFGLARRSGSVRRPPLWLAAVAIGAVFVLTETVPFLYLLIPVLSWEEITGTVYACASHLSWLAILWVGFAASRRNTHPRAWRFVLAAGVLTVLPWISDYLLTLCSFLPVPYSPVSYDCTAGVCQQSSPSTIPWNILDSLQSWWDLGARLLAQASLAVALLIGLRPVPREEPPAAASTKAAEVQAQPEADATASA
jgi:hypothetical protein